MSGAAAPLAWLLLAGFTALARLRSWPVARALLLAAMRRASRPVPASDPAPAELLKRFEAAYRMRPFPTSCLPRALALHRLLAFYGVPARLRLGLANDHGSLEGHAWAECAGTPVGEGTLVTRFRPCETS